MESRMQELMKQMKENDAEYQKIVFDLIETHSSNYKNLEEEHLWENMKNDEVQAKTKANLQVNIEGECVWL